MSYNLSYRVAYCFAGMTLLMIPCDGMVAEERFEARLRESLPLEIARRHAGPGGAFDRRADAVQFRSDDAVRRARAALFAADGLLAGEPDSAAEAGALSALKQRLVALTWSTPTRDSEVHHLIAMLAFRLGESGESLRHAARAVLAAPSSSRYHSNLAFFLHAARHVREAKVVYEHARRLDPDNTATHLGLLGVASESDQPDLREVEALVRDWRRRERVPELERMAGALLEVLDTLTSLDLPVGGEEHDSTAADTRLVRAMIRELLGPPARAVSKPASLATPASAPSKAVSSRSPHPVRDGLSYRVGGTEP